MDTPPGPAVRSSDEEQLRLLSIFHYIVAGLIALFACLPILHIGMGALMLINPQFGNQSSHGQPPPAFVGYLFIGLGAFFFLMGWAVAICTHLSGRYLARQKRRLFSFVIAALLCTFVPFGTVLGVFTLIVLSRESVQRLYLLKMNQVPPILT